MTKPASAPVSEAVTTATTCARTRARPLVLLARSAAAQATSASAARVATVQMVGAPLDFAFRSYHGFRDGCRCPKPDRRSLPRPSEQVLENRHFLTKRSDVWSTRRGRH